MASTRRQVASAAEPSSSLVSSMPAIRGQKAAGVEALAGLELRFQHLDQAGPVAAAFVERLEDGRRALAVLGQRQDGLEQLARGRVLGLVAGDLFQEVERA
jgi:hypothetical protein